MERNLSDYLIVLSGIVLSIAIGRSLDFFESLYLYGWFVILDFYLLIMIWLMYVYLNAEVSLKLRMNPLQVLFFPAVPFLFLAKHSFGLWKDVYYRPIVDILFMFSFLLVPVANDLELQEMKAGVSYNYQPYALMTLVGIGVFLLYVCLEDWSSIESNPHLHKSLGALAFVLAAFVFTSFAGSKAQLFWSLDARIVFGIYGVLLLVWFLRAKPFPIRLQFIRRPRSK